MRPLRLAVFALCLLALPACDASRAAPPDDRDEAFSTAPGPQSGGPEGSRALHGAPNAHGGHDTPAHRGLAAAEPSGYSIYHAASTWTDQTGTPLTLAELAGTPQVVAMVYTSCAYACPQIMVDMKRIEGELGDRADEIGFLIVSIDPERDTPERLAEFAAGSRLDPDRWTLLSGEEGDILELAALLGVQYREISPGEWVHSNVITVLDAEGVVVHRQFGLGTDPAQTLEALSAHMP